MKKWIEKLFPVDELIDTVKRFPLSVLCALSMFTLSILLVHEVIDEKEEFIGRIFAVLGCCYFWFGISKLMSESQDWSIGKYLIVSAIVAAGLAALFGFSDLWGMHLIFVVPALLLGLMFAPYLTGGDDISVWFFNRIMWFGVIVSYVALFMFAGGLSLALGAIHTLFEVKIDEKVYADIWLFASMVLGPLYALSWVPKNFEFTDEDCSDPPGLRFIANWISAPMVFIYLLILYAYFIKIVITGEVPNGMLAYMITGFAGAGIITYLISWPMRNTGTVQLRLFFKIFFPMLLIPVGFHFYAIWERVSAYGITEQRYMILLSAIWFAILVCSNIVSKMPIKAIPATLCMLLVFASFGPWGGVSLSGVSQFSRLEKLLVKYDILKDGEIVKAENDIPFEDRLNISSILDYLCQSERDYYLEPWFKDAAAKDDKEWSCYSGHNLTKKMGFEYVHNRNPVDMSETFYLTPPHKNYVDVSGYDMMVKHLSVYKYSKPDDYIWSQEWTLEDDHKIKVEYEDKWLRIFVDNYEAIIIDINAYAADKVGMDKNNLELMMIGENVDMAYQLSFNSMNGKMKDGKPIVENMSFDFLYKVKE